MDNRFKTWLVSNGLSSLGLPLMDMTLLWLFYVMLKNPILYIPVASARPIMIIVTSLFSGYAADKYDRRTILLIFGFLNRIFTIVTIIFIIFDNPLLAVLSFLIRTLGVVLTQTVGSISLLQLIPNDYLQRGIFLNSLVKESLTIIGILSWPLLFYRIGGMTAIIGVIFAIIGLIYRIKLDLGGRGKTVSFKDG